MKKELFIGGLLSLLVVFGLGYFIFTYYQNQRIVTKKSTVATTENILPVITMATVKQHYTENDCWLVINNQVYDVTNYLKQHPGGADTIIKVCGQDATAIFNNIKQGKGHSDQATQELTYLMIGQLK